MRAITLILPAALGLALTVAAKPLTCEELAGRAPWPTATWSTASPESQGLDPRALDRLAGLVREGKAYPDLHSLLIVRNGYLVLEEYFDGWTADRPHMQQSVTKSVTSALVGIALGRGEIESVDEKVLGFFPEYEPANLDDRKRAIRLDDLLTMRSGTDYHERGSGSPHSQLNRMRSGWTEFILDRPMVRQPGTEFHYDSGAVILTSAILESRSGVHADVYAERHLFGPMGIDRVRWFRNSEGHPHTGGGLDLRPRDMARFGLLYLRQGRWVDRQIVPSEWVEASFVQRVDLAGRGRTIGYGYWWWISEPDPDGNGETPIYSARGWRAQYIFVVPEHDMVVVVTGGTHRWEDERKPVEMLYASVLPALHRAPGVARKAKETGEPSYMIRASYLNSPDERHETATSTCRSSLCRQPL